MNMNNCDCKKSNWALTILFVVVFILFTNAIYMSQPEEPNRADDEEAPSYFIFWAGAIMWVVGAFAVFVDATSLIKTKGNKGTIFGAILMGVGLIMVWL